MSTASRSRVLRVDVWSDIACPWCFIGKRRLEEAIDGWEHKGEVDIEVTWRAFELDPNAPVHNDTDQTHAELIAAKYRMPVEKAQGMIDHMTEVAKKDGIDFHFEKVRRTNTFDAHRIVHLGTERGKGDATKERLLKAYMSEGEDLGDASVLVRLAREAGLDAKEAQETLATDRYADDVRAEEAQARNLGITGVPCFVVGEKYGISGAQSAEILRSVLTKAWNERAVSDARAPHEHAPDHGEHAGHSDARHAEEGAACGVDGCN